MIMSMGMLAFAGAALVMALTPGPTMIYLISRSLCQGKRAGVMSWLGIVLGYTVHMGAASVGLSALFMAVPLGYELLRFLGALYLLFLSWQAFRPGADSFFEPAQLPEESPRELFGMGLLTSILNPQLALFYLTVLPQFISPDNGSVMAQSLAFGTTQVFIGAAINLLVTLSSAHIALWLARKPAWRTVQRSFMGLILGGLAMRLLAQQRQGIV